MHPRPTLLGLLVAAVMGLPAHAEIQTYRIDPDHSFANWEVRHVVARVSGTFHDVQGRIQLDTDNVAKSSVEAAINVYSLNSSHIQRDVHLLTDEYLGAHKHPEMKFVSTRISPMTSEKGTLTGNLSLHGSTRPVTLDYQILGLGKDPWGGMRIGFKASTRINRSDYGISAGLPYGPVGNEVDITLLIEALRLDADGRPWNAQKATEPKVVIVPAPAEAPPVPVVITPAPAASVTPAPATPASAPAPAPEKKESAKDLLKKELFKGLLN
ncbi:MAG TPA: YceI family protein [Thiobacillaceae bacterium]|nr:YceI family protein [Thiobacillaceae bacterium]HNU64409.1 YceI family protein [Thiobacillaceae bacterium]